MTNNVPPFILRISLQLAVATAFIGLLIEWNSGAELGWAFLRGSFLFLAFGIMSRWWFGVTSKAWLESRLEAIQPKTKPLSRSSAMNR